MIKVTDEQIKNVGLLEFKELMKEVAKLPPELITRISDIAQGMVIMHSMEENKLS